MTHFVGATHTKLSEKDKWRTPQYLFDSLDKEFKFDLDVCADEHDSLCDVYFSEEDSALENEWNHFHDDASAFMNPPYSLTRKFLKKASEQAKKHNITVVALVNANTDVTWFKEAYDTSNEIRLITGRISFIKPSGGNANGNTKGQALIIWRGNCNTPCAITLIDRKEEK